MKTKQRYRFPKLTVVEYVYQSPWILLSLFVLCGINYIEGNLMSFLFGVGWWSFVNLAGLFVFNHWWARLWYHKLFAVPVED